MIQETSLSVKKREFQDILRWCCKFFFLIIFHWLAYKDAIRGKKHWCNNFIWFPHGGSAIRMASRFNTPGRDPWPTWKLLPKKPQRRKFVLWLAFYTAHTVSTTSPVVGLRTSLWMRSAKWFAKRMYSSCFSTPTLHPKNMSWADFAYSDRVAHVIVLILVSL